MGRFPSGWRTTMEPTELGWPVRYWWTADDSTDVAWCATPSAAAGACSALGAARAQANPESNADAAELVALRAAAEKRHACPNCKLCPCTETD